MKRKWVAIWLEIGKWTLILFLLYPFFTTIQGVGNLLRVVGGELLLVIFIGKMFYDTVFFKYLRHRGQRGQDVIALVGMLLALGVVLMAFFLLFAITLLRYLQTQSTLIR